MALPELQEAVHGQNHPWNDGVKDTTQLGVASTTGGSAWTESPMEGWSEGHDTAWRCLNYRRQCMDRITHGMME